MPKRKREADTGFTRQPSQKDIYTHLLTSKKLLHRALKTEKGFSRQKLGKRLKLATSTSNAPEIARINKEIEVVKSLDLDKVGEASLYKHLGRIKVFKEDAVLGGELERGMGVWKPEGEEETVKAERNVVSGILRGKGVREELERAMKGLYFVMGIEAPVLEKGKKTKREEKEVKSILKKPELSVVRRVESAEEEEDGEDGGNEGGVKLDDELPFEGFGTEEGEEAQSESDSGEEDSKEEGDLSLDEDTLAKYDALLGASSDEESFDEEEYKQKQASQPSRQLSLSLSPEPQIPRSASSTPSLSSSPEPESKPKQKSTSKLEKALPTEAPKKTKVAKQKPVTQVKGSTFLPTLMGGYWSGSEEEASDLEDSRPVKKNRPGQMARRAIAEKKYGEKANHIKSGQGPVASMGKNGIKDDGWDAKRGAKDSERGGRGGFSGRGGGRVEVNRGTNENAMPIEPRKRGMGKKDDVGVLHPSWQAAKKAKEEKKSAKFEGKKVVFD